MSNINLIKLAVGIKDLPHLAERQPAFYIDFNGKLAVPVRTRHKPREDEALLNGGSLYWVIKNNIMCRQSIIGIEQYTDEEDGKFCMIFLDPEMIMTAPIAKRPFQGWRYLKGSDVPADRGVYIAGETEESLPPEMENDLRDAGLL